MTSQNLDASAEATRDSGPGFAGGDDELLREQAALRHVATLVAQGARPEDVFSAVAAETSRLIGVETVKLISFDPDTGMCSPLTIDTGDRVSMPLGVPFPLEDSPLGVMIVGTGRPARIDDWTDLPGPKAALFRAGGYGQAVGAPIFIGGTVRGYMGAYTSVGEILPPDSETRLAAFTPLMALAIANVRAREEVQDLAESQRALRQVATLVAQGAEPKEVFTAVAVEASRLLKVDAVSVLSYDAVAQTFTKIYGTHGDQSAVPDGNTWPVADFPEGALLLETGGSARIDDWTDIPGETAARHRALGFGPAVGVPILIGGSIWGYIGVYARAGDTLAADCEPRLEEFTQLIGLAIANVQAREELQDLAESQGALRRVATLVAQGSEPKEVFTAVAVEASRFLRVGAVSLIRWDPQTRLLTKINGTHGHRAATPDGAQWTLAEGPASALVIRTGRAGRVDDWSQLPGPIAARHREQGFGQCVAAPIYVDGTIWGVLQAYAEAGEVLPPGSEQRLADYTNLLASAIANAQVRDELRGLAERQGEALRRVATLVGQQAPQEKIFNAVAGEASRALGVARVDVGRYDSDGSLSLLGSAGRPAAGGGHPAPDTFSAAGTAVAARVMATGRASRVAAAPVPGGSAAREAAGTPAGASGSEQDFRSAVGAPILVDGKPWGVIVVFADEPLPADTETRLTDFTHLVASSISNVHARDNLIASRARIVTASDETRRRIERNLHDGIQQRLLAITLSLRAVSAGAGLVAETAAGLDEVARGLEDVLEEVRVFSQGLHPALLSRAGVGPSLRELARRSPVPVSLRIAPGLGRFAEPVEIGLYYVISEAIANAAKHASASEVSIAVAADADAVWATIADDGVGGATLAGGSGLIGLVDRVEALGGRLTLDSPSGRGTTIRIELPLADRPGQVASA
jgi:signal transduction histidine kinase